MMTAGCPYLEAFEELWLALKPYRPIAFGTRLARITGRPKDAMLLSQLVYWTRRGRDVGMNGGWVHKTREHWFAETGLSREEQENVRRRLRAMNLVTEWRGGRPACLHYRLEVGAISTAVRENCRMVGPLPWSIEAIRTDEYAMRELLGPTVAFRRVFVDLVGNVNAALLLSRMVQLQRREADRQCTWFTLTGTEWQRTLGLNRRQLDNARGRLVRQGLIRELVRHRTGKRVFTQVSAAELQAQLEGLVSRGDVKDMLATRRHLLAESLRAECQHLTTGSGLPVTPGNSAAVDRSIYVPQTKGLPKSPSRSPQLDCGASDLLPSAGLIRYRWRETHVANARAYTRITYSTTTTAGSVFPPGNRSNVVVGFGIEIHAGSLLPPSPHDPLMWPAILRAEERDLIAMHLERVAVPDRQVLLDEMAASHRHQPVQLPVAYIAGLVRRYLAGEFVPAKAHLERAARRRVSAQECVSVSGRELRGQAPSPVSTPETARQHLAVIRARLRGGPASRGDCHA
jgi:hypothetical protein